MLRTEYIIFWNKRLRGCEFQHPFFFSSFLQKKRWMWHSENLQKGLMLNGNCCFSLMLTQNHWCNIEGKHIDDAWMKILQMKCTCLSCGSLRKTVHFGLFLTRSLWTVRISLPSLFQFRMVSLSSPKSLKYIDLCCFIHYWYQTFVTAFPFIFMFLRTRVLLIHLQICVYFIVSVWVLIHVAFNFNSRHLYGFIASKYFMATFDGRALKSINQSIY
jgi:hypothetical protein